MQELVLYKCQRTMTVGEEEREKNGKTDEQAKRSETEFVQKMG